MKIVKIALLGHGTVGKALRKMILQRQKKLTELIKKRTGRDFKIDIAGVLVSHPEKHPELGEFAFTEAKELLRLDYDLLVELIGGNEPASRYIRQALKEGKDVVTANKKALFLAQGELEKLALKTGALLRYEAAVAGAIPLLRSIQSLECGKFSSMEGIVNGSTNYVLTRVAQGLGIEKAIFEASERGFLEADPSSDLDGFDAMYKLGILTYLMTGHYPKEEEIQRVGLRELGEDDVLAATKEKKKYKLLVKADFEEKNYSVRPVALSEENRLYSVDGACNGVCIKHEWAGELTFLGAGAGGDETASAVLGDLLDILCAHIREGYYD